jgi:hypothetical protein
VSTQRQSVALPHDARAWLQVCVNPTQAPCLHSGRAWRCRTTRGRGCRCVLTLPRRRVKPTQVCGNATQVWGYPTQCIARWPLPRRRPHLDAVPPHLLSDDDEVTEATVHAEADKDGGSTQEPLPFPGLDTPAEVVDLTSDVEVSWFLGVI